MEVLGAIHSTCGARAGQTQYALGRGVYLYSPKREDAFEVRVGLRDLGRENEDVGLPLFIPGQR